MHHTDEEEKEMLKRIWLEYGKPVFWGVVIAGCVILAYTFYNKHQRTVSEQVSELYHNILEIEEEIQKEQVAQKNLKISIEDTTKRTIKIKEIVSQLQNQYADSFYTVLASFILAKQQVMDNNFSDSKETLNWLIKNKIDDSMDVIARIRLAKVLFEQGKEHAQEALDLLKPVNDVEFLSSVDELRGDLYILLGNKKQARQSYLTALNSFKSKRNAFIIQMKLDDLAVIDSQ